MENYATKIRRELHACPGVGFELDETLAIIRRELEEMGVPYTEKYGKSSIIATVNEEKREYTLAFRADTDALPISEKNDVSYKSKNEGKMHACGHDAHTAILLDTIRKINKIKDEIPYRVKFIFQSAEEYTTSGAKLLCESGAMRGVSEIFGLHVTPRLEVGKTAISVGPQSATSLGFYLNFYGKSAHAAHREDGIDAIKMATLAYLKVEDMISEMRMGGDKTVFHVGKIEGGKTNNIVADKCSMFATLRSVGDSESKQTSAKIKKICESVAAERGGAFEFIEVKCYPVVINDEKSTDSARRACTDVVGEENVVSWQRDMGGEDFSYYTRIVPGCLFRLGTRNEELGVTEPLHSDRFNIDERALNIGSDVFLRIAINKAEKLSCAKDESK